MNPIVPSTSAMDSAAPVPPLVALPVTLLPIAPGPVDTASGIAVSSINIMGTPEESLMLAQGVVDAMKKINEYLELLHNPRFTKPGMEDLAATCARSGFNFKHLAPALQKLGELDEFSNTIAQLREHSMVSNAPNGKNVDHWYAVGLKWTAMADSKLRADKKKIDAEAATQAAVLAKKIAAVDAEKKKHSDVVQGFNDQSNKLAYKRAAEDDKNALVAEAKSAGEAAVQNAKDNLGAEKAITATRKREEQERVAQLSTAKKIRSEAGKRKSAQGGPSAKRNKHAHEDRVRFISIRSP
jgi:hypothetical protein